MLELVRQKSKEKQSRNMRVKCLSDEELSMERKEKSCGADSASRCYKEESPIVVAVARDGRVRDGSERCSFL